MTDPAPEVDRGTPRGDVWDGLEQLERAPDGSAAPPELPGPGRLVGRSLALLRAIAPDVRRGALAVGLQFLGLLGPLLVLVAAAIARLPEPTVLFGAGPPGTPADVELAGLVGIGILVAAAGGTALAIESRAIGLALVATAARGRPVSLPGALRRSRQSFWRLVALSVAVELPLGLLGSLVGEVLVGPEAAGSPPAAALGFLVALVLQVPIVYAAAGIVVGGLGVRAALRESIRLVARAPRLLPVVVGIGAAAQVLLVVALNGGLELMIVVADLADLDLAADDPARTFGAIALLLGASSAVGSLLFSVTCLATAPQAVVVALAGRTLGLDQTAAAGEASAASSTRWLTLPMALGIATAVLVSVIGIQNVVGRG